VRTNTQTHNHQHVQAPDEPPAAQRPGLRLDSNSPQPPPLSVLRRPLFGDVGFFPEDTAGLN
jgi:hypothetical protein